MGVGAAWPAAANHIHLPLLEGASGGAYSDIKYVEDSMFEYVFMHKYIWVHFLSLLHLQFLIVVHSIQNLIRTVVLI